MPKPVATITSNAGVKYCFGQQAFDLQAGTTDATQPVVYTWQVPQNSFGNQTNVKPTFNANGNYIASVQILDSNNCADTSSISLQVLESPTVVLTDDAGCIGTKKNLPFTINPTGFPVQNYDWFINGSLANQSGQFEYEFTSTNPEDVELIIEGANGCKDTSNLATLRGIENPVADFTATVLNSTSSGVPVKFENKSSGENRYEWTFEKGATDITENPTYKYTVLGNKTVVLKVWNSDGCFDTAQKRMFVTSDQLGFIPNAFSPNKNGPNEVFKPAELSAVSSYSIKIFNRWGEIIYQSTDPNEGWDGTYMGADVPEGVYGYQIYAQFITGVGFLNNGSINLIR